ncbi:hypothetical protein GJ496_009783 [Pomphorhynchus laevis]|nr:hypothetical protein GJ496_009783 [Pomphorhynchus laevis]
MQSDDAPEATSAEPSSAEMAKNHRLPGRDDCIFMCDKETRGVDKQSHVSQIDTGNNDSHHVTLSHDVAITTTDQSNQADEHVTLTLAIPPCYKILQQHFAIHHPTCSLDFVCSFCDVFNNRSHLSVRAHAARCKLRSTAASNTPDGPIVPRSVVETSNANRPSYYPGSFVNNLEDNISDNLPSERDFHPKTLNSCNHIDKDYHVTVQQEQLVGVVEMDISRSEGSSGYVKERHASTVDVENLEIPPYEDLIIEVTREQHSESQPTSAMDSACNMHCMRRLGGGTSNVTIANITDHLNNLYQSTHNHPRFQRLLANMLMEVANATDGDMRLLLVRLVTIYTIYLTGVDNYRRPMDKERLQSLRLNAIELRASALTTLQA